MINSEDVKMVIEITEEEYLNRINYIKDKQNAISAAIEIHQWVRQLNKYSEKETIDIYEMYCKIIDILNENEVEF